MENLRRFFLGEPLASSQAIHQRLSKTKALAVFSSDALSSTAYATEAILLVLIGAGTGALGISMWVAVGIAALLLVVSFSYFQTIHAYPNGGGAYIVAKDNLGSAPGLTAAAALLIDYILTVAVSVSAGVAALSSAFPELERWEVRIALLIVAFITLINLRGVRESGTFFSIPTYAFIVGIFLMIGVGLIKLLTGGAPGAAPESAANLEHAAASANTLGVFLLLRAFAAGCTALTGVEAISNGIPAFKPPESHNAGRTLIVMVALLCAMFIGITFLANHYPITVSDAPGHRTVLSQLAANIFGDNTLLYYYLQFATLFILSLAANTAYADFPRLASLIARDRYLPHQLSHVGDRLVFSNGIIMLAVLASVLILMFDANEHHLLPLYAIGVFLSFTLSQSGMVVHWLRSRNMPNFRPTAGWMLKLVINAVGAVATFVVLLILLVTRFGEGGWLVVVAIPVFIAVMLGIHRHYAEIAESLTLRDIQPYALSPTTYPSQNMIPLVVLIGGLNRSSLQAIEYAIRFSDNVRVCHIEVDTETTERLKARWGQWPMEIPLDIVPSPYREVGRPLIEYLHERDQVHIGPLPTVVVLPEFVVERWWERFLHNQTSVAIRAALYHDQIARGRGRPVINVPYRIGEDLYQPLLKPEQPPSPVESLVEPQPSPAGDQAEKKAS